MEPQKSTTVLVAYAVQGKPRGRDLSIVQCFYCKRFGHYASNCLHKFCNYCKKDGHILKDCPTRSPKKSATTFITTFGSSDLSNSVNTFSVQQTTPASPQTLTLEMVQQMVISTFSALELPGKHFSVSSHWYFDFGVFNHMTNNPQLRTNTTKYF